MQVKKTELISHNIDNNVVNCARTAGLRFLNRTTGEIRAVRCKCYSCEFCGKRKVQRLFSAVERYFSQFTYIRMWTFTAAPSGLSLSDHRKMMQKAWTVFWKEFRRSKFIAEKQRKVKYFRVVEAHQSGYIHYHVLVTEWMKWEFVQNLWNWSLAKVLKVSLEPQKRLGSVNVKASHSAKSAAGYVAKYVIKAVKEGLNQRIRKWSRSEKTAIFDVPVKDESQGKWELHRVESLACAAYDLYLSEFRVSTQKNAGVQIIAFDVTDTEARLRQFWAEIEAISE